MTVAEALTIEQAVWSARPSVLASDAEERWLASLSGHLRCINLHLPEAVITDPALSFLRDLERRMVEQKSQPKQGKQRKARTGAA